MCLYDYFFKFLSPVPFTVFHLFSNHFNSKKNYSLLLLFLLHQNHFHFQIYTQLKKKNAEKEEEEYTGGGTGRIHERNKKNYTGQWFDPLHCSSSFSILSIWFPFLFSNKIQKMVIKFGQEFDGNEFSFYNLFLKSLFLL
jgi:hypothetical protein